MRFFATQGRHVAPMGVKLGIRSPPPCQIHPNRRNDKVVGPQRLTFLVRFDQNVEYKRPAEAYPLRDFHKICSVCTPFQEALAVKTRYKFCKICKNHARDTPLRGVYIPHFNQIRVEILLLGSYTLIVAKNLKIDL